MEYYQLLNLKKASSKKVLTVSLLILGLGIIGVSKALTITSGCTSSTFCTLSELIGGGSIAVDGVTFNNFNSKGTSNQDQIQISGIGGGTNVGLNFQDNGDIWKLTGIGGTHSLYYNFVYNVAVSGGSKIIGRTIKASDFSTAPSTEWRITSHFYQSNSARSVSYNDANGANPTNSGGLANPVSSVSSSMSLFLTSHDAGKIAEINSFQQNFALDVAAVPLPAAVWLLGSGVIFLSGFRRKKAV